MFLEITKLHHYKKSQTEGIYMMIEMRDTKTGKWYQTFLCPGYRNFAKWRKIARIGNQIFFHTLKMKTENIIDADSYPCLLEGRRILKDFNGDNYLKELAQLGTFG